jgi:hypothetical protein
MKKLAAAALLAACTAASAGTVYTFKLTSTACANGSAACPGPAPASLVEGITVELAASTASISVTTYTLHPGFYDKQAYQNSNFQAFNGPGNFGYIDLAEQACVSDYYCRIEGSFTATSWLDGSFLVNGTYDDFFMSSDGTGLWSGYLNSDNGPTTIDNRPVFTGYWEAAINDVPEPGSIALLGAGLIGMIGMRKRRPA